MVSVFNPDTGKIEELTDAQYEEYLAIRDKRWGEERAKVAAILEPLSDGERWALRQALAGENGMYYGAGGTIHESSQLDVEVDSLGKPIRVWFRCLTLPFLTWRRDAPPNASGRSAVHDGEIQINGIEYVQPTKGKHGG